MRKKRMFFALNNRRPNPAAFSNGVKIKAGLCLLTGLLVLFSGVSLYAQSPYPEPEARAWLNNGERDISGFFKRFENKNAVELFLNKLCSNGVIYVGVVSTLGEVSGLRIYLPLNRERRGNVFDLVNKKLSQFGFSIQEDKDQDFLTLWF